MISLPTFRGVLSGFNPLSLSPALWLNDTGSDPSVWTDMSGNGRNASQATAGSQPAIVTNALNGRQVRRFDGVDDLMGLTTGLGMVRNVAGATVIVAYKWITNPTSNKGVFFASVGTSTLLGRVSVGAGVVSRKIYSGGRRLDGDTSFASCTASADNPTTFFISSSVYDYANSDVFQYINSVLDGQNTTFQTSGNTSDTDSATINLGVGNPSALTSCANIDLAEILVFPTVLSTINRQKVERYLSGKYAIAF